VSFSEPNRVVRPTDAEGDEFLDQDPELGDDRDDDAGDVDPAARPSGSPPATND
jgi:hypothetical protein